MIGLIHVGFGGVTFVPSGSPYISLAARALYSFWGGLLVSIISFILK